MLNLFRYIGLRQLRMRPARSLLTTLGVCLGVALYIAILIINRSTVASFRENIEAVAGKSTLTVSAGESGFPEATLDTIAAAPGVLHAAPVVETRAFFAEDKSAGETLVVLGVDLLREQSVRSYKMADDAGEPVVDDPLVFLNQPDSIIVTRAFAAKNGLKIDSSFELATAGGKRRFTVRGLLTPDGPAKAYGGGIAIMDIDGARVSFGKENKLDRVDIITRPGENIDQVAQALRDKLGTGLRVERPDTQGEEMERMVKSFQIMLTFFSTLALLVGIFLVGNSVSISVAERRREIGTLRALGATRTGVVLMFLSEALAMGVVGSLAGAWVGRRLADYMVGMVSRSLSLQYLTPIHVARLQFGLPEISIAVLIGGGAATLAAFWPSLNAASVEPLEAMRAKDLSATTPGRRAFLVRAWGPLLGTAMFLYLTISSPLHLGDRHFVFEILNQVSAMVGAALLGPWLVSAMIRSLRRPTAPVARLAHDNLIRNPKRTGSNVMSLMIGLILVIMIAVVNTSFRTTIVGWFGRIVRYDLLISSTGRLISYQVQPLREELAQEFEALPGYQKGPERSFYGVRFVHFRYADKQVGIKAFDEFDPRTGYTTFETLDRPALDAGRELFHSSDPVVMVSENFVLHFGKKTGDILKLDTPSGTVAFRIVAVMVDFASSQGVLYLDRRQYKKYWKDPLVDAFGVKLEPGVDPQKFREEVDRRFGRSRNLMVTLSGEFRAQMIDTIDQSFAYTRAIEGAALMVGLLGLFNTLLISVLERMRELGMLRAVGMSRRQMAEMILREAILQGAFGAIAAVALGSWIAYLFIKYRLAHALGWVIHFYFPWMSLAGTVVLGLVTALVAGIYPAYRAAHCEIVEALEYE